MVNKFDAENSLKSIRDFSLTISEIIENKDKFVERINSISKEGRNQLNSIYDNAIGPVKTIRKEVASILVKRDISKSELEAIIDARIQANPDSYKRMYKNWFNFLYMFILQDDKDVLNTSIETISNYILQEINDATLKVVKFDFTGERETGSKRTWLAFFNNSHPNQKTAKQLFINIEQGVISYCLNNRQLQIRQHESEILSTEPVSIDKIVSSFKELYHQIKDDSFVIPPAQILNIRRPYLIYKVSMSPKDLDNDAFEFFMNENLIVVHSETPAKGTSSNTQGDDFSDKMKIGDFFYLTRGNTELNFIGKIVGNCQACVYGEMGNNGWLQREFEVIYDSINSQKYRGVNKWWTPNNNSTFIQIPENEIDLANDLIFRPFFNVQIQRPRLTSRQIHTMEINLNSILFGPPGTGKTYNTIEASISITNPNFQFPNSGNKLEDRKVIKAEFERLCKNGQIVFTTFHQSMSYEDFIEGIKPETIDKSVVYNIQNGIFKIVSNRALFALHNNNKSQSLSQFNTFDELYDLFIEDLGTRLANKTEPFYLPLKSKGYFVEILSIDDTTIETKGASAANKAYVEKEKIRLLYNKFSSIDQIKNVTEDIRSVGKGLGWSSNYYGLFKELKRFESTLKSDVFKNTGGIQKDLNDEKIEAYLNSILNKYDVKIDQDNQTKYVLIIDEINRGNVSQIFGELITLIEEDKRLGKTESLEITLPYSKETFSVPPNLHIIGTMNTADRSVEALDTALRRRFSFIEMMPDYNVLKPTSDGLDLADILKTINKRLCYLINEDHQIGHSYFIGVTKTEELEAVFENKIIPLLKEYFYNDASKIQLVLGEGFVKKENKSKPKFAVNGSEVMDKEVYSIVKFDEDFDIIEAVKAIGKE